MRTRVAAQGMHGITNRDLASTLRSGSGTQETEDGVDNPIWVVCLQALCNGCEELFVTMLCIQKLSAPEVSMMSVRPTHLAEPHASLEERGRHRQGKRTKERLS